MRFGKGRINAGSNGTITLAQTTGLTFLTGDGASDNAMSFTGTTADINAALDGLTFTPTTDFRGEAIIAVTATDENHDDASGNPLTAYGEVGVAVGGPVILVPETQSTNSSQPLVFSWSYGNGVYIIDPAASTAGLQVDLSISNGTLTLGSTAGLTFLTGDGASDNAMSFTGLLDDVNRALEGMFYTPSSMYLGQAILSIGVTDLGTGWAQGTESTGAGLTIEVGGPYIGVPNAQWTNENAALTFSSANANAISVSSPIGSPADLEVTLSASNGKFTLAQTTGLTFTVGDGTSDDVLAFSGTVSAINAALDGMTFTPTTDFRGETSLFISADEVGSQWQQTAYGYVPIIVHGLAVRAPLGQATDTNVDIEFSSAWDNAIVVSAPGLGAGVLKVTLAVGEGFATLATTNGLTFLIGSGTNENRMVFTGTLNAINSAFDGLLFAPTANYVGGAVVYVMVENEATSQSASAVIDITVGTFETNENLPPTIEVPDSQSTAMNTPVVFSTGNQNAISVADPDAGSEALSVELVVENASLTLAYTTGLSFSEGDGSADTRMAFTGTLSAINTAVNGLTFTPDSGFKGFASIGITVNDQGNSGAGFARTAYAAIEIEVGDTSWNPVNSNAAIVISQIYASGGESGATYNRDYIEVFNRGSNSFNLTGISVQYADAQSSVWQVWELAGTLAPGKYLLIATGSTGSNGAALPTPDFAAGFEMSAAGGKVALVNGLAALQGATPTDSSILDAVGYGESEYHEGEYAALGVGPQTAIFRLGSGTVDTNENGWDFNSGAPEPRNSSHAVYQNSAPVLSAIGNATIDQNDLIDITPEVSDADGPRDSLIFSLTQAPAGASIIAETGRFLWLPGEQTPVGNYAVTIRATDTGSPALYDEVSFTITVTALPKIAVSAIDSIASPTGGDTGMFRFKRTGDLSQSLQVSYSIGGSAIADADYQAIPGTLTFGAAEDEVDVEVVALPALAETKYVEVQLEAGTGFRLGFQTVAVVTLLQAAQPDPGPVLLPTLKLDVNKNKVTDDILAGGIADGVSNYLPGYEGKRQAISVDVANESATFEPQQMYLVIDGLGWAQGYPLLGGTSRVDHVAITMLSVSNLYGFAGNATANAITDTNDDDFSFHRLKNLRSFDLYRDPVTGKWLDIMPSNAGVVPISEETATYIELFCKDFGGKVIIQVDFFLANNVREETPDYRATISIPLDADKDGIADVWEEAAYTEWKAKYGPAETLDQKFTYGGRSAALNFVQPVSTTLTTSGTNIVAVEIPDNYERHYTGTNANGSLYTGFPASMGGRESPTNTLTDRWYQVSSSQAGQPGVYRGPDGNYYSFRSNSTASTGPWTGDGLSAFYEYRGIMASGAVIYDKDNNLVTLAEGHKRLSLANQEILVDVNLTTGALAKIGGKANLKAILDTVATAFVRKQTGVDTRVYFMLHDAKAWKVTTPTWNKGVPKTIEQQKDALAATLTDFAKFSNQFRQAFVNKGQPFHYGWRDLFYLEHALDIYGFKEPDDNLLPSGFSSIEDLPMGQRAGSFVFVSTALKKQDQILLNADTGLLRGPNYANLRPQLTPHRFLSALTVHELTHQLDERMGHYNDANGDGRTDAEYRALDFDKVQFDYTQTPRPTGYLYQDYWGWDPAGNGQEVIKFGQGYADGFLLSMNLGASGFLDNIAAWPQQLQVRLRYIVSGLRLGS